MTHKKVNNFDAGTANKHGGNDLDKWSDFATGIDVDDYDINSDIAFRQDKHQIRNSANTFGHKHRSLATAARVITYPDTDITVNAGIPLTGLTVVPNDYAYKIYLDGANTRLVSLNNMATDVSNSDAKPIFDAAVAIAGGPTIKVMPGTYLFSDSWNCVDKNFKLVGTRVAMNANSGQTGDTILKANFDHATKPLINEVNTTYSKQQFKDIVVDCDFRVAYGIDAFDVKEVMPWLENVAVFNADIDGVSLANTTYVSIVNPIIARNAGAGLHWKGPTSTDKVNTTLVLGGRITTNGYNVRTTGYVVGNEIIGCIMENNNDYMPFTNSIRMNDNSARDNVFRDCSLEYFGAVNKEIIYDNGYNNRYDSCRFGTFHSTYTPIHFGSTSRNCTLSNAQLTCNAANTQAIIIQDAGGQSNRVVAPGVSWSIPMDVVVKNAGAKYALIIDDIPLGFHAIESHLSSPFAMRWGTLFHSTGWVGNGLLQGMTDTGTQGASPLVASENNRARRWTTGTAAGDNAGIHTTTSYLYNTWNPRIAIRFRCGNVSNSRVYMGFNSTGADPSGNDPLLTLAGFYVGKISTNGDWVFMHNNASGSTIVDDVLNIPADNLIHTVYLEATSSALYWQLDDNDLFKVTSEIPAADTLVCPVFEIEAVAASGGETIDIFEADMRAF